VAYKQNRSPLVPAQIPHLSQGLLLEIHIPDRKHLVRYQYFTFKVGRYGKAQPHVHSRRVALYRRVYVPGLYPAEGDYFVQLVGDLAAFHSEDRAVHKYVFTPGQLAVEAGPYLKQAGHPPVHMETAPRRRGDAAQYLKKRGFSGPVLPHNRHAVSLLYLKVNIRERPKTVFVVHPLAPYFEVRVFPAKDAGKITLQIFP